MSSGTSLEDVLSSTTYSSTLIQLSELYSRAVSLWESLHVTPEDVRGVGLTLRNVSSDTVSTPIHHFFEPKKPLPGVPSAKKRDGGKRESNLISRLLTESHVRSVQSAPMIELPPLESLDIEVFRTLPSSLQDEMLGAYLSKEPKIPPEYQDLFKDYMEREEEMKIFLKFVDCLMIPIMDERSYFAIRNYVLEYEANEEAVEGICVLT